MVPDSIWRTFAARRASCWERNAAFGAPSARKCDPSGNGRVSRRRRPEPLVASFRRPIAPFWSEFVSFHVTLEAGGSLLGRAYNECPDAP
jgi:hypothetical protein